MYDILELSKKLLPELRDIAKELKIKKPESLKKQDLIYKILDLQAVEATDKNSEVKDESSVIRSINKSNQDYDSGIRRSKRPRTRKPVSNRPVESVISVSPDDLKRPEQPQDEWQESVKKPARTENKPDLFKNVVPPHDHKDIQPWKRKKSPDEKREKPLRPEKLFPAEAAESIPDLPVEPVLESNLPLINDDTTPVEPKSETESSSDNIIVEAPVKEDVHEIHPVTEEKKEEKKEKPYEFEGIIYNTGVLEIMPDGYGFLRSPDYNYLNSPG